MKARWNWDGRLIPRDRTNENSDPWECDVEFDERGRAVVKFPHPDMLGLPVVTRLHLELDDDGR